MVQTIDLSPPQSLDRNSLQGTTDRSSLHGPITPQLVNPRMHPQPQLSLNSNSVPGPTLTKSTDPASSDVLHKLLTLQAERISALGQSWRTKYPTPEPSPTGCHHTLPAPCPHNAALRTPPASPSPLCSTQPGPLAPSNGSVPAKRVGRALSFTGVLDRVPEVTRSEDEHSLYSDQGRALACNPLTTTSAQGRPELMQWRAEAFESVKKRATIRAWIQALPDKPGLFDITDFDRPVQWGLPNEEPEPTHAVEDAGGEDQLPKLTSGLQSLSLTSVH